MYALSTSNRPYRSASGSEGASTGAGRCPPGLGPAAPAFRAAGAMMGRALLSLKNPHRHRLIRCTGGSDGHRLQQAPSPYHPHRAQRLGRPSGVRPLEQYFGDVRQAQTITSRCSVMPQAIRSASASRRTVQRLVAFEHRLGDGAKRRGPMDAIAQHTGPPSGLRLVMSGQDESDPPQPLFRIVIRDALATGPASEASRLVGTSNTNHSA